MSEDVPATGQPMSPEDRKFWVWLALWGGALLAVLAAGLSLAFGEKMPQGIFVILVSLGGMAILTLWLVHKKPLSAPFVMGALITLTWLILAYGWWWAPPIKTVTVHEPPTQKEIDEAASRQIASRPAPPTGYTQAEVDKAVSDATAPLKSQITNLRNTAAPLAPPVLPPPTAPVYLADAGVVEAEPLVKFPATGTA
jgi:hypothetical protein